MTQPVQLSHIPTRLCFTSTRCFSLADLQITPRGVSHANSSWNTLASASCRAFWRCATCRLRCTTEISSLNTWQFSLIFSNRWTSSCLNSMRGMFTVRGRFMQTSAFMWVSLWLQSAKQRCISPRGEAALLVFHCSAPEEQNYFCSSSASADHPEDQHQISQLFTRYNRNKMKLTVIVIAAPVSAPTSSCE